MATDEHRLPIKQISDEHLRQAVSIMTTEHFTLQGGRGNIISEVNGRLTIFFGALSSSLIALGFVGQSSRFGGEFRAFALIILPALLFIGIATLGRLAQCNRETAIYGRGINRIRHFYGELVPDLLPYFTQSTHDDFAGDLASIGLEWSAWQPIFSVAFVVGMLNAVLGGVLTGLLLTWATHLEPALSIVGGIGAGILVIAAESLIARFQITSTNTRIKALFPTPKLPARGAR